MSEIQSRRPRVTAPFDFSFMSIPPTPLPNDKKQPLRMKAFKYSSRRGCTGVLQPFVWEITASGAKIAVYPAGRGDLKERRVAASEIVEEDEEVFDDEEEVTEFVTIK